MTTLQYALDHFESSARVAGHRLSVDSNELQPFAMLVGDSNQGLRLTWDTESSRLVIAITYGTDQSCLDWLDLYDMEVENTDELPIDRDISITDAIDHGFELVTPKLTSNPPNSQGRITNG